MLKEYLYDIVNETVMDITKKLAGIELEPNESACGDLAVGSAVLKISLTGTQPLELDLLYEAQPSVCRAIAERMKRAPVEDSADMEVYIKEYFNVICGRIISRINRERKMKMRFGVPTFYSDGLPDDIEDNTFLSICYEWKESHGSIRIAGVSRSVAVHE